MTIQQKVVRYSSIHDKSNTYRNLQQVSEKQTKGHRTKRDEKREKEVNIVYYYSYHVLN